ncbi:hypothetical protein NEOLEDRAFT_24047 [Neolentinus lepideus HHB14362 ss-1]|uniref:Uncharacterized protein n=1 Tax=Neolentinus lepideus HHB14362 ss-1 TaxID=1314782 RepID=A0A165W3H7_9AGAM|nr:hypothetical protein NEOLEDRAFT_24047 [Neolentinus lepideus HHB14362 ss-1]
MYRRSPRKKSVSKASKFSKRDRSRELRSINLLHLSVALYITSIALRTTWVEIHAHRFDISLGTYCKT